MDLLYRSIAQLRRRRVAFLVLPLVLLFFFFPDIFMLSHIGNNQSISIISNPSHSQTPSMPMSPSSLDQNLSYPFDLELYESKTHIVPNQKALIPFGNNTSELFTVWTNEKMPSKRCYPARSLPHTNVFTKPAVKGIVIKVDGIINQSITDVESRLESYRGDGQYEAVCSEPQFTNIYVNGNGNGTMFSMECPADGGNGRWARSMNGLMNGIDYVDVWNGTAGNLIKLGRLAKNTLEGPRNNGTLWDSGGTRKGIPNLDLEPSSKSPGVDWVYTACTIDGARHTNLRIHPYRIKGLSTTPESAGPYQQKYSVALIIIDSVSHGVFARDFKETKKVLEQDFHDTAFIFNHTTVFGYNSGPNVKAILLEPNIFEVARESNITTSAFEDYCGISNWVSKIFPYKEHLIAEELLCNYHEHLLALYYSNPRPGCEHGEPFINHHLRYIQDYWNIYKGVRKLHVSKPYGCHMERHNQYTCNLNDQPLANFLKEFVPQSPETAVIIASDHGFHWNPGRGKFNNHIAGEYEHRNPFLGMIVPWAKDNTVLRANTKRLISHRDLHATILGLLNPLVNQTDGTAKGFDLLQEKLPERRSCEDVGIPDAWCNCFRPRTNSSEPKLDVVKGTQPGES